MPTAEPAHITEEQATAFVTRADTDEEAQAVAEHTATCDRCRELLRRAKQLSEAWDSWSAASHGTALRSLWREVEAVFRFAVVIGAATAQTHLAYAAAGVRTRRLPPRRVLKLGEAEAPATEFIAPLGVTGDEIVITIGRGKESPYARVELRGEQVGGVIHLSLKSLELPGESSGPYEGRAVTLETGMSGRHELTVQGTWRGKTAKWEYVLDLP